MGRLLPLVCAIVLVDTIFFAALTPLLPHYVEALGFTKADAGLLAGAFAAGTLIGAVPSGFFAGRFGAKPTALVGLALGAVTSLAFGLAGGRGLLLLTRLGGGIASACSWTAGASWLTAEAPRERRGELIGVTVSAAVAGGLLGPVLGSAAAYVGTDRAFAAVAAAMLGLVAWVAVTPGSRTAGARPLREVLAAMLEPRLRPGMGCILLSPLLFSVVYVLAALELGRRGFGPATIGAIFVGAAAIEVVVHPALGRWGDRRGYAGPVRAGLAASSGILLALPWVDDPWVLGSLVVLGGVAFSGTLVPGMAMLARSGEDVGLDLPLTYGLANLAWALGHASGGPAGGALAQAAGDAAAYLSLAGLCLAALWLTRRSSRVVRAQAH
jgi:MFS family permease